nr:DUF551 domain-containing protein [Klebsiella quasipneumoniae]
MTKSTITRERVVALIAEHSYDSALVDALEHLLAAMDSEPYCKERKLFCSTDTARMRKVISVSAGTGDAPLYRHAQQPVVEREPIAWLNDAYLARGVVDGEAGSEDAGPGYIPVYREAGPHPAPVVPDERDKAVDADDHPLLWSFNAGWNACSAAMLAAAQQSPGSEPATVPGKWIPVSERMPEDSGRYWCYVEEQNDLGKSHYQWNCSWNGDRWWVESEGGGIVTHWMQLPAAPQEVK